MVRTGEIMTRKVISVSEDTSIEDLCGLLYEGRITGAPVVDQEGMLVGIVSKDDVVGAYFRDRVGDEAAGMKTLLEIGREGAPGGAGGGRARRVADIMTRDVVTVTEDTPVKEILHTMVTKGIHRVIVVKEGKVRGIVSAMNVLEALLEDRLKL
jgi:CBS domain-containing protein